MTSTLRHKVDAFFNPAPGADNDRVSAAQLLDQEGHGYEDDGEHMHSFFNKDGKSAAVDVNPRSIHADIEMQGGAYDGKKVSRSELEAEDSYGEDDMESGEEEMEEGELEMEDGESAMSASSSASVPLGGL